MHKTTPYDGNLKTLRQKADTKCEHCDHPPFPDTSRLNRHLRTVHCIEPTKKTRSSRKRQRSEQNESASFTPSYNLDDNVQEEAGSSYADDFIHYSDFIIDDSDESQYESDQQGDENEELLSETNDAEICEEEEGDDSDEDDELELQTRANIDAAMREYQHTLETENSEWQTSVSEGYPFDDPQTLVMMCLYNGYANPLSRAQLKTLLYGVQKIVDLAIAATKRNDSTVFKLPRANKIMKCTENKSYLGPRMEVATFEHKVTIKQQETIKKCSAILPSEHLKFSMANPREAKYLTALPDRTNNASKGLHSGEKWINDPAFQHPQVTVRGCDFWVGDLVEINNIDTFGLFLIKSFFTKDNQNMADGFHVTKHGNDFRFTTEIAEMRQDFLIRAVDKSKLTPTNCVSFGSDGIEPLTFELKALIFGTSKSRIENPNHPGHFFKVAICPLVLFSDDTSGGNSKQHIPYESWSMVYAATPYEERSRRENTKFIGCAPKSDGLTAMHFIPGMAEDLKSLEKGILMFSSIYNELVLVQSPIVLISADNPAHSDICGLLQQNTLYFCRMCYFLKASKKKGKTLEESGITIERLNRTYLPRTRHQYELAASSTDLSGTKISGVLSGPISAKDLSFKETGSGDLVLKVPSFDPSKDTPVEALHCIPLGVGKYLIEHLVKVVLAGRANESRIKRIESGLEKREDSKAYARTFRRKLRHVGSFVGRDFKQLMQVLPDVLSEEFLDIEQNQDIFQLNIPLKVLGKLCSLAFVRQIPCYLEEYITSIKATVEELTAALYRYDIYCQNPKPFCTRPKVHYLHHLHENIRRFGCALQFETEKGEMFNKFIREQLFHTNRHSPSRDVALRFSRQEALKHVVDGGSWINSNMQRANYGKKIEESIDDKFREKFFGAREFSENNHLKVTEKNYKPGFSGIFKRDDTYFIGTLNAEEKILEYNITEFDLHGRPLCKPTGREFHRSGITAVEALDMNLQNLPESSSSANTLMYTLNLNKFGTTMLLKCYGIYDAF